MKNPSNMTHQFSRVPEANIQRSVFDRSHSLKTTFDAGLIVPIYVDEALPGDTFNLNMTGFARLATPIKPIMDNLHMETFFFAVPNRLLWDNWQKFNGEQESPGDSTDYTIPQVTVPLGGYTPGSIGDYFGLPIGNTEPYSHSALWHRAYAIIWNEWFRDQNLEPHIEYNTGDTVDPFYNHVPYNRGKRYDYFTSCLPWPQKGDPVSVPLNGIAPVVSDLAYGGFGQPTFKDTDGGTTQYQFLMFDGVSQNASWSGFPSDENQAGWDETALRADLTGVSGWTINEMREAFQIQRMLEKDARGGTRYTEVIRAHFGVTSPDARLQRPEFLGGGYSPVNISPVAQTAPTADDGTPSTPQANLSGIGTATLHGHGFTKSFTEHCTLLGFVCVRADLTYQQGLDRMWSRETRYDFYWPALAHLGEQAVLNKEIYCIGGEEDDDVFGYQERYAEYRYKQSKITGLFRSNLSTTLDVWHLAQFFTNRPVLGETFIAEQPPIDRIIAVQDEPHFLFDAYFKLKTARPMPLYGVPGRIDQF